MSDSGIGKDLSGAALLEARLARSTLFADTNPHLKTVPTTTNPAPLGFFTFALCGALYMVGVRHWGAWAEQGGFWHWGQRGAGASVARGAPNPASSPCPPSLPSHRACCWTGSTTPPCSSSTPSSSLERA